MREECSPGFQRTVTIALDTAQYQLDMEYMQEHKSEDVYSTFNLLMRRKPKVIVDSLQCSWTDCSSLAGVLVASLHVVASLLLTAGGSGA